MILRANSKLLGLLIWLVNPVSLAGRSKLTTNITPYEPISNPSIFSSVFSPRMDFDQWKPLTGRGDPLRNDPTYDYEPPVLEKVHYWADDREQERKSEVLVLGVSSRKPSVTTKPPIPPRRHTFPLKYEAFAYKFGDNFPMTILVPPPPPPPGHNPALYITPNDKGPMPILPAKLADEVKETTTIPEHMATSYVLQEANLVYQASTTKQNWFQDHNKTTSFPNNTVSSDYAGWGPTTPFEDNNDIHNLISYQDHQNVDLTKEPLFYYKPILSEAPPPPRPFTVPLFLPTALPPTITYTEETLASQETTLQTTNFFTETTTEQTFTDSFDSTPKPLLKPKPNIIDMLGPMLSMPMVTDPNRPEDNLYPHASNTIQIFKEPSTVDLVNLEIMQTMQPPPPVKFLENTTPHSVERFNVNSHILNNVLHDKPVSHTHDPYLHMRYTTPMAVTVAPSHDSQSTTESQSLPTYLIIQGHSKVKTYGSKPKPSVNLSNKIPHPNETTEVKHLHPIKDKYSKTANKTDKNREGRTQNLKSLIDAGLGSIEIQEANVGIKYDVSDGSDVPVEIYRKGIVDNYESDYLKSHTKEKRNKRQVENIETVLPFYKDSLKEIVHNVFYKKNNDKKKTGFKAQAINNTDSTEGRYDEDREINR